MDLRLVKGGRRPLIGRWVGAVTPRFRTFVPGIHVGIEMANLFQPPSRMLALLEVKTDAEIREVRIRLRCLPKCGNQLF